MVAVESNTQVREYKYDNVCFIITEKKIAVETRLQFFYLEPLQPYYVKRLRTIALLIEMGQIKTMTDLIGYAGGRLNWVPARREWLK